MISRGFPNVLSNDLPAAKRWYEDLLSLATEFDSDWFVHLRAPAAEGVEVGLLDADHELVPLGTNTSGNGVILTFVVDDVDETYKRATTLGYSVIEPPVDQFYGQRRMILSDPDGTLVDISSECQPSQEFLDSLPHRSEH